MLLIFTEYKNKKINGFKIWSHDLPANTLLEQKKI
ncbi:hypothetical protein pb186bvf_005156 [Paramecium bursaria]